jgi:hypothetical protein
MIPTVQNNYVKVVQNNSKVYSFGMEADIGLFSTVIYRGTYL